MLSFLRLAAHLDALGQYDLADRVDRVAQEVPTGPDGEPLAPLRSLPSRDEVGTQSVRPVQPTGYRIPGSDFDPSTVSMNCPECGGRLVLRPSQYGPFWGCENWGTTGCKGSVSAHADGRPMGTPVTAEVKKLRRQTHELFDQLWQGPKPFMTRDRAYQWMQQVMGLSAEEAHMGQFGADECRKLLAIVIPFLRDKMAERAARREEYEGMSPEDKRAQHERDVAAKHMQRLYDGPKAIMTREQAYAFMAEALGLTPEQAHIRNLDRKQAAELVRRISLLRKESGQT